MQKNKYNKTIMEPLGNGPVVYIKKNVVYSDVDLGLCSRTPPKACQCHDGSGKLCKPIFEEYRRNEQQCAHRKQSHILNNKIRFLLNYTNGELNKKNKNTNGEFSSCRKQRIGSIKT